MQQLTQKDIACVIGLYHKTHSRKQVARELGLSEYRVRRILIDNGILGDYDATIAAAIDAGDTPEDAARKFGVTPDTIRAHLPYTKGIYCFEPVQRQRQESRNAGKRKRHRLLPMPSPVEHRNAHLSFLIHDRICGRTIVLYHRQPVLSIQNRIEHKKDRDITSRLSLYSFWVKSQSISALRRTWFSACV